MVRYGDFMKISTKGRYGLRAMVDFAVHGEDGFVTLRSVSTRQGIPEGYLEQIVATLKKAGFVKSTRGAQGGYLLNVDPNKTTALDILTATEGSLYPVECVAEEESNCSCCVCSCSTCVTKPIWQQLYNSMSNVLKNITLSDLAKDYINEHIQKIGDDNDE